MKHVMKSDENMAKQAPQEISQVKILLKDLDEATAPDSPVFEGNKKYFKICVSLRVDKTNKIVEVMKNKTTDAATNIFE